MNEAPAKLEDQPDTLAMIETAFGGARDILMNGTTMRYLSDHIEELIAARVAVAWQASRKQALEEVAALFPQPHIEYFGDAIADAIRSLTSPIGDKA